MHIHWEGCMWMCWLARAYTQVPVLVFILFIQYAYKLWLFTNILQCTHQMQCSIILERPWFSLSSSFNYGWNCSLIHSFQMQISCFHYIPKVETQSWHHTYLYVLLWFAPNQNDQRKYTFTKGNWSNLISHDLLLSSPFEYRYNVPV